MVNLLKVWWLIGFIFMISGFLNPHFGFLSFFILTILLINFIFGIIAKTRQKYKGVEGAQGAIFNLQGILYYFLTFFNFILIIGLVLTCTILSFKYKPIIQIIPCLRNINEIYIIFLTFANIIFGVLFFILTTLRMRILFNGK